MTKRIAISVVDSLILHRSHHLSLSLGFLPSFLALLKPILHLCLSPQCLKQCKSLLIYGFVPGINLYAPSTSSGDIGLIGLAVMVS